MCRSFGVDDSIRWATSAGGMSLSMLLTSAMRALSREFSNDSSLSWAMEVSFELMFGVPIYCGLGYQI